MTFFRFHLALCLVLSTLLLPSSIYAQAPGPINGLDGGGFDGGGGGGGGTGGGGGDDGGSGGGGNGDDDGGGGGYTLITEDLALQVSKLVSFDNTYFFDASSVASAAPVKEEKSTLIYIKTNVTNLGNFSATDVQMDHFFKPGLSNMLADSIQLVAGDVTYNSQNDSISISKIEANETVSFVYSFLLHELGQNRNTSLDGLELVDYGSNLPINQDALNYASIGDQYLSYFLAKPSPVKSGSSGPITKIQGASSAKSSGSSSQTSISPGAKPGVTPSSGPSELPTKLPTSLPSAGSNSFTIIIELMAGGYLLLKGSKHILKEPL